MSRVYVADVGEIGWIAGRSAEVGELCAPLERMVGDVGAIPQESVVS